MTQSVGHRAVCILIIANILVILMPEMCNSQEPNLPSGTDLQITTEQQSTGDKRIAEKLDSIELSIKRLNEQIASMKTNSPQKEVTMQLSAIRESLKDANDALISSHDVIPKLDSLVKLFQTLEERVKKFETPTDVELQLTEILKLLKETLETMNRPAQIEHNLSKIQTISLLGLNRRIINFYCCYCSLNTIRK